MCHVLINIGLSVFTQRSRHSSAFMRNVCCISGFRLNDQTYFGRLTGNVSCSMVALEIKKKISTKPAKIKLISNSLLVYWTETISFCFFFC